MKTVPPTPWFERPPANLSYGVGGIDFLPTETIAAEQAGYAGPDWNESWLVVARETTCGDPIFVDRSQPGFPVLTAMNGMGSWDASPVAPSWEAFLKAIEAIRPLTVGRQNPVGLEANPLPSKDRDAIEKSLQNLLGSCPFDFWELLLSEDE